MSQWRLAKIPTPSPAPPTNYGSVHYNSSLTPPGLCFEDEGGTVFRLTEPHVKMTADGGALTTATLADVGGLVFPLLAGSYYRFLFHLLYTTTVTTSGLKFGLTYTAGVTAFAAIGRTLSAADGVSAEFQGLINSSGDSVTATDAQATGTTAAPNLAVIEGTIIPSVNGNLQVQAANEAAAGTVVVKQGSNGSLWLLP